MPALLIAMFWLGMFGCIGALRGRDSDRPLGLRGAAVLAAILTGAWTVAGSEILSLGHHLEFSWLVAWWAVPVVLSLAFVYLRRDQLRGWIAWSRPDTVTTILVSLSAVLLLATGLMAACTLTNTWDCWQYHLPRQVYWIQQHSVAHYAAHDLRQLEMPPMAEMVGAHLMILSGGDSLSNLVQWTAFLLSAVAASATAAELGAGARGQALAAFLVVTIPGAVSESTNGKNDVVVTLWALALAYVVARVVHKGRCTAAYALAAGAAAGLALLTKGTGYIIAAPLLAAMAIGLLKAQGHRALPAGLLAAVTVAAINLPHWVRNERAFGDPIATPMSRGGYPVVNTTVTVPIVVSNLLRDLGMHAGTPSPRWNEGATRAVASLHSALGIELNDPRSTMLAREPFKVEATSTQDGNAAAPAHLLIALALLGIGVACPRLIARSPGWGAFALPFAAFVLFAVALRWQPWQLRLQIPFLALFAPVAACVLPRTGVPFMRGLGVLVLLGFAAINLIWGDARSLVGERAFFREGRAGSFYHASPWLPGPISAAAARAAEFEPRTVGLSLAMREFEYPLLRALSRAMPHPPTFLNLNPNFGPKPGRDALVPDVVIAAEQDSAVPIQQRSTGQWFVPTAVFPPLTVYVRADRAAGAVPIEVPPFFGWARSEGLERAEGPYPQWNMPVVRWSKSPTTTLIFQSDGRPSTLHLECRRNDREDQEMRVRLNGEEVFFFRFGEAWAFFPHRVALRPTSGRNVLVIEYANTNFPNNPRSVQYSRLQIVPDDGPAATPAAPGPTGR